MEAELRDVGVWAYLIVGIAGFVCGLIYRIGAVIFLSFIALVTVFILSMSHGSTFWFSALYAFSMIFVLQLGYVSGVAVSVSRSKMAARSNLKSRIQSLFKQDTVR